MTTTYRAPIEGKHHCFGCGIQYRVGRCGYLRGLSSRRRIKLSTLSTRLAV
jgi:hypothetical protein